MAGHASFPDSIRRKDVGRCGHQNKISQVVSAGKLERNVTAQLAVVTYPERSSAGTAPRQAVLQLGGIEGLDEMAVSVGGPAPTSSAR